MLSFRSLKRTIDVWRCSRKDYDRNNGKYNNDAVHCRTDDAANEPCDAKSLALLALPLDLLNDKLAKTIATIPKIKPTYGITIERIPSTSEAMDLPLVFGGVVGGGGGNWLNVEYE